MGDYKKTLSTTLLESTKHKTVLDFMAESSIVQVGPPRINVHADLQK